MITLHELLCLHEQQYALKSIKIFFNIVLKYINFGSEGVFIILKVGLMDLDEI
jgi:hypothetical protein